MTTITEQLNCVDSVGNKLIATPVGGMLQVGLKLANESRVRDLGKLLKRDNKIVYTKYVDEKNIFRKANAWGLNYKILSTLPDDASIELHSKTKSYTISVSEAKKNGKFLFFKEQGFEKQWFIPLNHWS